MLAQKNSNPSSQFCGQLVLKTVRGMLVDASPLRGLVEAVLRREGDETIVDRFVITQLADKTIALDDLKTGASPLGALTRQLHGLPCPVRSGVRCPIHLRG